MLATDSPVYWSGRALVRNTYEQLSETFWIDAQVLWPDTQCTVTIVLPDEPEVLYEVQAYVVHRHNTSDSVASGALSGHYYTYFKRLGVWYKADDERVTKMASSPTEFPYLVALAKCSLDKASYLHALRQRENVMRRTRSAALASISCAGV